MWPVLGDPAGRALGDPDIDLKARLWTLWWAAQPARAALTNHPTGGVDFFLLTPVGGALALVLDPVPAHNLSAALAVLVALAGGALWGGHRGGAPGAVVGGLGLATAPALTSALRDGTGEFGWLGLVALCLWATDRHLCRPGRQRPPARAAVATGLLLGLTALSGWYLGLAAGLGMGLLALAHPQRRRALPAVLLAGAVGLAVALPAARAFSASDLEPLRLRADSLWDHLLHGAPGPEPDAEQAAGPLLPRTQLVGPPGLAQPLWLLLLALPGLAALRAGRGRALLLPGAVALVLSLGSATPGGLPLPMLWANRVLSWLGRPLHLPFHLGALTTVVVVGLAATGTRRPRAALALGAGLIIGAVVPQGALPMDVLEPFPSRVPAAAGPGAVVELPSAWADDQPAADAEALHQIQHGRPIPRFPVFPTSLLRTEGLAAVRGTALLRALPRPGAPAAAPGPVPALDDLRTLGYGSVMLDTAAAPDLAPWLDQWLGPPAAQDGRLRLYRVAGSAP